jgi:hypothetical protein
MSVFGKLTYKLVGIGAGVLTAKAATAALNTVWGKAKGSEPPGDPADVGTPWSEALSWAVASGVALAVGRLVATKGTASAWVRATGNPPPGQQA